SGGWAAAAQSQGAYGPLIAGRGGIAGGGSGQKTGLFQSDGALAHCGRAHQVSTLHGTEKTVMKHPNEGTLALFAGHDLNFLIEWRVGRHVARCEQCRGTVDAFVSLRSETVGLGELPPDIAWNRLASEMKANIRLGLAAGECVSGPK